MEKSICHLKGNIWILGFDTESDYRRHLYGRRGISNKIEVLLQGKTTDIPENIACLYVKHTFLKFIFKRYENYNEQDWIVKNQIKNQPYKTAKESILSSCSKPYCVIFKTGNIL